MCYKAVDLAIVTPCPSHVAHLVLIALAKHYNPKTGRCFPSYERMSAMLNVAKSSVTRAIKELEAAGLISKRRGHRRGENPFKGPNHYRLLYYVQARLEAIKAKRRGYHANLGPVVRPEGVTLSPPLHSGERVVRSHRRKPNRRIDPAWAPTKVQRAYAATRGFDDVVIDQMAEHFRLWWTSKGEVRRDWGASWYIWVNNQLKFAEKENARTSSSGPGSRRTTREDDLTSYFAAANRLAEKRRRQQSGDEGGDE